MLENGEDGSAITQARRDALTLWLVVSCIFIGVSLLSVPIPGVNEPHYLSKARSYVDAEWCANDFFLQSGDAHAVFFAVVGPVTHVLSFGATILLGRTFSLLLLGWGWSMLGRQLCLTNVQIVVAASTFCLIAMTGNFSGEWVIGGFESKVPAYGCALAGVAFWLRAWRVPSIRNYAIAAIMAGLSVAWHPVVGLWFCIGIAVTELVLLLPVRNSELAIRYRFQKLLVHGITFTFVSFIFALPGLVPAMRIVMTSNLSISERDKANYIQVFWRLAHHLDPGSFAAKAWIHTAVLACVCISGLALVGLRRRRRMRNHSAPKHVFASNEHSGWWPLIGLLGVAGLTAAAGVIIGWHDGPAMKMTNWPQRAMFLKFYPFRFFDALLPMTTAFVLAALPGRVVPKTVQILIGGMLIVVALAAAGLQRPTAPSGYSAATFHAWKEACAWLKTNTPHDVVVYGPRESFGMKVFAERAEYVCFKDCPQDAKGILEWDRRLWKIYRWSAAAYQDQIFDQADLTSLHQQTGVTHILTRRLGPFETDPVWQNKVWRIYETVRN